MRHRITSMGGAVAAVALFATGCGDASGAPGDDEAAIAEHFSGETIVLNVGYGPGGGYDIMARMLAEHMGQYIPGHPTIIVQNNEGGASLNAARMVASSRPNGLTVGVFSRYLTTEAALGYEHEGLDMDSLTLLGTGSATWAEMREWCTRAEVATSFEEALAAGANGPVQFAFQGVLPESTFVDSLDLPFESVYGYDGLGSVFNAVQSGEVDGTGFCYATQVAQDYPAWIEDETVVPIFTLYDIDDYPDPKPNEQIYAESNWDRPPKIEDVFDLSEQEREILEVIRVVELAGVFNLGVPEGTPDHVVEALREGVRLAVEDPEYQADMRERGREPGYKSPDEIEAQLDQLREYPDEVRARVLEMVKGG